MKNLFFSSLILALFSLNLHAQVQVGVRAGVHWSTVRASTNDIDQSLTPGFLVVVPIQAPLAGNWRIRAEPSFIQKSWQAKVDYTIGPSFPSGTGKMVQHYEVVELPLLISYRQKVNNHWAYYGLLGPSIGYILGGRLTISEAGNQLLSDKLLFERRIETGIWGGGGAEISLGRLTTFLDIRYQYGLSKYPAQKFFGVEATHGFTVSVGCWLPSKK